MSKMFDMEKCRTSTVKCQTFLTSCTWRTSLRGFVTLHWIPNVLSKYHFTSLIRSNKSLDSLLFGGEWHMAFIEPTATSGISVWVPIGGSSGLLCLLFTILMWAEVKPPWSRQHREKAVSLQNKGKIVWVSWLLTFSLVVFSSRTPRPFVGMGCANFAWSV